MDAETALSYNGRMLKALILAAEAKIKISEKESNQGMIFDILRSARDYLIRGSLTSNNS